MNARLNIRYSAMQGSYWAMSGIIFNFAAVYLQARAYSNYEIGIIITVGNIVTIATQPLLAALIDRRGQRSLVGCIGIMLLLSVLLSMVLLFTPENSLPISSAYVLLITANLLMQPLCTALCFYVESWGYHINFGRARAVGSLCYSASMLVLGTLVERTSADAIPLSLIAVMVICGVVVLLFGGTQRRSAPPLEQERSDAQASSSLGVFVSQNKRFVVFLTGVALIYFTHSLLSNFFIEFVRNVGGDKSDMGKILAFMSIAEVPVMLFFSKLLKRFSCRFMLCLAAVVFTVKELAIYLASDLPSFYAAEALQALSFALLLPAAVQHINDTIPEKDVVKGQSFFTAAITLGSVFAGYFGGLLLDGCSVETTLLVGVIVSAVGTAVAVPAIAGEKKS